MQIALAPMEGLVDEILRDLLTQVGGIDWCVTEFIRITNRLLPLATYEKYAPELASGSMTRAGVPMRVQFLGSDPVCLAENAAYACTLGAPVIDLNFGCPAKTVNNSKGGAILLNEPELLHSIVSHVRRAVPSSIPVTAKMRLGYDSLKARWSALKRWFLAGRNSWLCMPVPKKMAINRPLTGSGLPGLRKSSTFLYWLTARSGRWRITGGAVRCAVSRKLCWGVDWFPGLTWRDR